MKNINMANYGYSNYNYMKSRYYKKPSSETMKKRVEEIEKGIEENKEKFTKRIKQLDHIVKDLNYIPKDSANGYHEFIQNMHSALVGGRKITRKMESSIVKIITTYTEWLKKENDPEYKKNKIKYIENSLTKIKLLEDKLYEANYSKSYMSDKEYFLDSIKSHVKSRGNLSSKQKQALNKMYKQFNKRIENNKKGNEK
tara:strand:- start:99 stop:692 length:594 start_codon:yes stop_codon:yes gene_type:complete